MAPLSKSPDASLATAMVILLMGVAGSGKTTVGRILAQTLGWSFYDADDLHSEANRLKMSRGIALTDEDRRPWLAAVHALVERCVLNNEDAIVGCSALKQAYRETIVADLPAVKVVYLKGSPDTIAERLANRHGHFFNRDLMQTQFDTLEEPQDAITVDIGAPPAEIVGAIRARLGV